MAKFCTKCGSELVDNVCPKCKDEQKVVASQSSDIKGSFMECVNIFKSIFTRPVDTIKEFVSENKFIVGIIMIVATALSTGLYKIAILKSGYSAATNTVLGSLSGLFGASAKPEYLKEFMTTFATNAVEYALIAIIGYLVVSKLFKGKSSLKEMIVAVGISLTVVFTANVVNSVLVFIDVDFITNVRIYLSSFASILSTLILFGSVKQIAGIDENKLFVTVASMSVFASIAMDLIQKLFD